MSNDPLDPAAVVALAVATGIPLADAQAAERIAAGAEAAIRAVRDSLSQPLLDYEPGDFLPTLERLADLGVR